MTRKLLAEFPPVSAAEWEAAIDRDLKGASRDEKLMWRSPEGLTIPPYSRAEDFAGLNWAHTAPGQFPYVRGARSSGGWRIRESIDAAEPSAANRAALQAVAAGAEEIAFTSVAIRDAVDLALLTASLGEIPLHFAGADAPLVTSLLAFANKRAHTAAISAGLNPLADRDVAAGIAASAPAGFVPFTLSCARNPGSAVNAVEETAATLAAGIEFLAAITDRGIRADRAAATVEFSFALGANYFFEIARLRAFRMLWARVVESFSGSREAARARIAAHTTLRNEPGDTAHMNILRATTEAMAAALGGADSITVIPFPPADAAARRLARNIQLILKHEALFTRGADPGGGSYCLESITEQVANASWKRLQEIESSTAPERRLNDAPPQRQARPYAS